MDIKLRTTHTRSALITISKVELETIMKNLALEKTGFAPDASTIEVSFKDNMEGWSTPYKSGSYCEIRAVEDQLMLPEANHD